MDPLDVRISREQVSDIEERWPSLTPDERRLVDEIRRLRLSVTELERDRASAKAVLDDITPFVPSCEWPRVAFRVGKAMEGGDR